MVGVVSHQFDVRTVLVPLRYALPNETAIYNEWPREELRTTLPEFVNVATVASTDFHEGEFIESTQSLMGKPIHVLEGDRLEIALNNYLPTSGISLHFHGFEMRDSIVYDGVVGVTQCAVSPYDSFLYNFTVDEVPGTYWYHTHSGNLGIGAYNGIKGPLIVHPKNSTNFDILANGNDIDSTHSLLSYGTERILFFADGNLMSDSSLLMSQAGGLNPSVSKNDDGFTVGSVDYHFGTCNGKLREIVNVYPGETYKLRLLNGGSHYAYRFHIDGIPIRIIAADSEPVEPFQVDDVILHTAERFDVEITIPIEFQGGESFWIRADTLESTVQGYQNGIRAILNVLEPGDKVPADSDVPDPAEDIGYSSRKVEARRTMNCYSQFETDFALGLGKCIQLTDLKPSHIQSGQITTTMNSTQEFHSVDFEFSSNPQFAHFVSIDHGAFIQHENPTKAMIHSNFDWNTDLHPNTAMMHVSAYSSVVIVWRNKSLMDHPMHLHGYKMEILAIDLPSRQTDCTLSKCNLNTALGPENGQARKLAESIPIGSGVLKDTFILPAGGAVATRIQTREPSLWFAHCHIDTHKEDGMAFILNVGDYHFNSVKMLLPIDYPSCDTPFYKTKREHPSCPCYVNEDAVLDGALTANHRCSRDYLCHHTQSKAANLESYNRTGFRISSQYSLPNWAIAMVVIAIIVITTFIVKKQHIDSVKEGRQIRKKRPSALHRLQLETAFEWKRYRPGCINTLRVFEVTGLATLTGYLFYDVGNTSTATGLSEKYSLLFFTITLWTFTRMYPAVPNYNSWRNVIFNDSDRTTGVVDITILCFAKTSAVVANEALWPFLYCFVCFPLAGMFQYISSVIQIAVFLSLNTICYVALGGAMGVSFDFVPLGMSTCTIISQTTLVAAGFYTQLPMGLSWIRYVSPFFWTYRGIMKTSLRWSDTYSCIKGQSEIGSNQCYLEFNPGIDALKRRGIDVVTFQGGVDGVALEYIVLCFLFVLLQLYTLLVTYKSIKKNCQCTESATIEESSKSSDVDPEQDEPL